MRKSLGVKDMDEVLQLGGSIALAGFKDIDRSSMAILKKIIGNYAKKFSESCEQFEELSLHMKKVHEREGSNKFELHGKVVDNGKAFTTEVTDHNLFFVIDKALKKIEQSMKH